MTWASVATIIGALSALVAAPMALVIFYLRAIREDQRETLAALRRHLHALEVDLRRTDAAVENIARAYTTKEEWLRETMLARRQLERLSEQLARLAADMDNTRNLATQFGRATHAIIQLADQLAGRVRREFDTGPPAPVCDDRPSVIR
jgi:DNA repair ATPase RecN